MEKGSECGNLFFLFHSGFWFIMVDEVSQGLHGFRRILLMGGGWAVKSKRFSN